MKRLVDGKKMRQVVPVRVHELVDPLDTHRSTPTGLDRERGVVEAARLVGRAVAPDRRRLQPHALWKDELPELADGDLVVVDALHRRRRGGGRHRRRDHERRHVLRDALRRKTPARSLRERLPRPDPEGQEQDCTARSAILEQLSTRDPRHRCLLVSTGEPLSARGRGESDVGALTARTFEQQTRPELHRDCSAVRCRIGFPPLRSDLITVLSNGQWCLVHETRMLRREASTSPQRDVVKRGDKEARGEDRTRAARHVAGACSVARPRPPRTADSLHEEFGNSPRRRSSLFSSPPPVRESHDSVGRPIRL